MKKSIIIIVVLVVIGLAVWMWGGNKGAGPAGNTSSSTPSAVVTETTKVSEKLSEYKNEELGFSVKYPSVWETGSANSGVSFIIPVASTTTNTIRTLGSKIVVNSGKCSFPPVTTIKERSTMKSGALTFNMISMSNTVQGNNYFDRMYSLQKDNICYIFSLTSVITSPASKGLKGSEATQVTNNNKAILDAADQAFIDIVKSFAYVVGPQGQDESKVVPI